MTQQLCLKKDPEDALAMGYKFRSMIKFIERTYPKISDDIIKKVLDITPYEIKTLSYTPGQYKRLEEYCEQHNYKPSISYSN